MPLDLRSAAGNLMRDGYSDEEVAAIIGSVRENARKLMESGVPDIQVQGQTRLARYKAKDGSDKFLFAGQLNPLSAPIQTEPERTGYGNALSEQFSAGKEMLGGSLANPLTPAKNILGVAQMALSPITAAGQWAGEATTDMLRGTPLEGLPSDIISGTVQAATPMPILKAATGAVKMGTQALGKFVNPGATRTAGVQASMEKIGAVPDAIERAYTVPASKAAYAAAEAQPPIPIAPVIQALDETAAQTGKAIPNKPALRVLEKTKENIRPPVKPVEAELGTTMESFMANKAKAHKAMIDQLAKQPTEVRYKEVMDEVQGLRTLADQAFDKKNNVAGVTLHKAAQALLDKMDDTSPIIKQANALYKREQGVKKVHNALTSPRPDVKIENLFTNDPLVQKAFNLTDAKMLRGIARELNTMGTQASPYSGVGARAVNFIMTPISKLIGSETGIKLLRQTFKDGNVTKQGLMAAAQLGKAYEAVGSER